MGGPQSAPALWAWAGRLATALPTAIEMIDSVRNNLMQVKE
jgi:hypothetical protein